MSCVADGDLCPGTAGPGQVLDALLAIVITVQVPAASKSQRPCQFGCSANTHSVQTRMQPLALPPALPVAGVVGRLSVWVFPLRQCRCAREIPGQDGVDQSGSWTRVLHIFASARDCHAARLSSTRLVVPGGSVAGAS